MPEILFIGAERAAAASNDILIPVFKKALDLKQSEVLWIQNTFYVAYTIGSLIYFATSALLKKDLFNKIGYRNGLALGLLVSALGTLLFIPASTDGGSFPMLLGGLFISFLIVCNLIANKFNIGLG